jgi:hypothetical protein
MKKAADPDVALQQEEGNHKNKKDNNKKSTQEEAAVDSDGVSAFTVRVRPNKSLSGTQMFQLC